MKKIFLIFIVIFISACASNALTWQDGDSFYLKLNCKQENQGKYWGECYLDKRMNDPNYENIVSNQEKTGYPAFKRWEQIIEINEIIKDMIAGGASYVEMNKRFENTLDEFNSSFVKYQKEKREKRLEDFNDWADEYRESYAKTKQLIGSSSKAKGQMKLRSKELRVGGWTCKYGFGLNEKILLIGMGEECPLDI